MKTDAEKLLGCYQVDYPRKVALDVKSLKGRYIPEKRLMYEKMYSKELVDEVFGPPTHLESAESLILDIESGKAQGDKKYEYLINIFLYLNNIEESKICSQQSIPLRGYANECSTDWLNSIKKIGGYAKIKEMEKAKNWLSSYEAKKDLFQKVYYEYIFELIFISLKEIFEETKRRLMG